VIYRTFNRSQLLEFLDSGEYKRFNILPVTPMRIRSQVMNPYTGEDDTLLIIALNEENEITGYCGILPGQITGGFDGKIFWNTCWWTDPVEGKGAAVQLLYRMLKATDSKMVFSELTPHTRQIIEKFRDFAFPSIPEGLRGYIRLNLHGILPARYSRFQKVSFLLRIADAVFNALIFPVTSLKKVRHLPPDVTLISPEKADEETADFMHSMNNRELFNRTAEELNLIIAHPWVTGKSDRYEADYTKYYFSAVANGFSTALYKIYISNVLSGICYMTNRDGFIKIPYIVFRREKHEIITKVVLYLIGREEGAHTFTTFNPFLSEDLKKGRTPFFLKKSMKRNFAIHRSYSGVDYRDTIVQDGAGDVIFT